MAKNFEHDKKGRGEAGRQGPRKEESEALKSQEKARNRSNYIQAKT